MTRTSACLIPLMMALLATPARAQDAMPGTVQDGGAQAARPTMTVADFDTDRTGWMPPPRLGTTLAEMLTDRLVATGQYRMMDREWLVSAQDDRSRIPFPQLVERAAGAGVDYLVAGSVTRLSIEDRSSTGGGAVPLPLIGALIHKHKTESVIGLTIRVIDVRTGEVVATSTAEKGATQKNTAGGGIIVIGPVPVFGAAGSSSTGFHDRLLDTAVQQAVTAAADKIVAAASKLVRSSK
jgi:curli biogenesis system outer membrane secretion channel CsgG